MRMTTTRKMKRMKKMTTNVTERRSSSSMTNWSIACDLSGVQVLWTAMHEYSYRETNGVGHDHRVVAGLDRSNHGHDLCIYHDIDVEKGLAASTDGDGYCCTDRRRVVDGSSRPFRAGYGIDCAMMSTDRGGRGWAFADGAPDRGLDWRFVGRGDRETTTFYLGECGWPMAIDRSAKSTSLVPFPSPVPRQWIVRKRMALRRYCLLLSSILFLCVICSGKDP